MPAELSDRRSRLAWLRRCREELEAEQARAEQAHQEHLRRRAEWEAEHGRKLGGRKPFPPDPAVFESASINTTDPDSRLIARRVRAPVQGYNAQAVATTGQIIVAADITQDSSDGGQLEPMIRQALTTVVAAGVDRAVGTVLADGGYWNSPQITALGQDGINVIVPTSASHRTKPRKLSPKQGPEAERIDRLLDTPDGKALYRHRQQIIEPVFANTKFNRGITRSHRRGLAACHAEWRLITATHNLPQALSHRDRPLSRLSRHASGNWSGVPLSTRPVPIPTKRQRPPHGDLYATTSNTGVLCFPGGIGVEDGRSWVPNGIVPAPRVCRVFGRHSPRRGVERPQRAARWCCRRLGCVRGYWPMRPIVRSNARST